MPEHAINIPTSESPFTVPELECRNCDRTERHIYCWRWLERLRLILAER